MVHLGRPLNEGALLDRGEERVNDRQTGALAPAAIGRWVNRGERMDKEEKGWERTGAGGDDVLGSGDSGLSTSGSAQGGSSDDRSHGGWIKRVE